MTAARKPYQLPAARALLLLEAAELASGASAWAARLAIYAETGEKPEIRPRPPAAGRIPEGPPWERRNDYGEIPGDLCCLRSAAGRCWEHNPDNFKGWTPS